MDMIYDSNIYIYICVCKSKSREIGKGEK